MMYRTRGFTLIELMVVVAIIMLLAAIGVTAFNKGSKRSCGLWSDELEDLRWCAGTPACQMTREDGRKMRTLERMMKEKGCFDPSGPGDK
jgi:prepilin-type N-terminal cleavage/methylation domain-containing protein